MYDQIFSLVLGYFLCEYSPMARRQKTEDIVREYALNHYSSTRVEEFLDSHLEKIHLALVNEFNDRFTNNKPLRFEIVDKFGEGKVVKGIGLRSSRHIIAFQDALNRISHTEFEKLAAILLQRLGCHNVFFTPESHDQGVDAFGYQSVVSTFSYCVSHHLIWIAQAKHYSSTRVTTGDVRELVGSKELLVAKAFSTVDERYKELKLRAYAPTALVLVTSEEVPITVRRLAERSGLFVFSAYDLFELFRDDLSNRFTVAALSKLISTEAKKIPTLT
jgi:hypothetical protein